MSKKQGLIYIDSGGDMIDGELPDIMVSLKKLCLMKGMLYAKKLRGF